MEKSGNFVEKSLEKASEEKAVQQTPAEENTMDRVLLNSYSYVLCPVIMVLSFILPYQGIGVNICYFKYFTHLPCPGCGLSRSMIHISHGKFYDAFLYHPYGFLLYFLCWFVIIYLAIPQKYKNLIEKYLKRNSTKFKWYYMLIVYSFILWGVLRMLWYPWFQIIHL